MGRVETEMYYEQTSWEIGCYIKKHKSTVKVAAEHFHLTENQIYNRIHKTLPKVAYLLSLDVIKILKSHQGGIRVNVQTSQGNKPDNDTDSNIDSNKVGSMAKDKG